MNSLAPSLTPPRQLSARASFRPFTRTHRRLAVLPSSPPRVGFSPYFCAKYARSTVSCTSKSLLAILCRRWFRLPAGMSNNSRLVLNVSSLTDPHVPPTNTSCSTFHPCCGPIALSPLIRLLYCLIATAAAFPSYESLRSLVLLNSRR